MGFTTSWPLSQKPKICHLRNDAEDDFSDFWRSPFQACNPPVSSGQIVGTMGTQKLLNVPPYRRKRSHWGASPPPRPSASQRQRRSSGRAVTRACVRRTCASRGREHAPQLRPCHVTRTCVRPAAPPASTPTTVPVEAGSIRTAKLSPQPPPRTRRRRTCAAPRGSTAVPDATQLRSSRASPLRASRLVSHLRNGTGLPPSLSSRFSSI